MAEPAIEQRYLKDVPENRTPTGEYKARRADVEITNGVKKTTILIDVRTCAITPNTAESTPVEQGEKDKHQYYSKTCQFPSGISVMPFAIDTHGRWGAEFKAFLVNYCKAAAGTDGKLYNLLITRARNTITIAHARAVGDLVYYAMDYCVHPADKPELAKSSVR